MLSSLRSEGELGACDVHVELGNDIEIKTAEGRDVEFGLSWDFYDGMPKVDLDCSVLAFDFAGILLDACYYNQLNCCNSSIKHSGDVSNGEKEGFDEFVTLDLNGLNPSITMMAFVVNAYKGGSFKDVESAYAVVQECVTPTERKPLADLSIGCVSEPPTLSLCPLRPSPNPSLPPPPLLTTLARSRTGARSDWRDPRRHLPKRRNARRPLDVPQRRNNVLGNELPRINA
jgi:stress response protein SCP2